MKAVIELDVPEHQIGSEVTVLFKDATERHGVCAAAKKGMWIVLDNCSNSGIYCSECSNKIFEHTTKPKKKLSKFCPNCGAQNELFFNPTTEKYLD